MGPRVPDQRRHKERATRGDARTGAGFERLFVRRIASLCVIVALVAAGLVYRMVDLQGDERAELIRSGQRQRTATYTIEAQRGSILDRNGVELAVSIPRRTIAVDMTRLTAAGVVDWADFDAFASLLAPYVDRPADAIAERLKSASADALYVVLARNVAISKADELMEALRKERGDSGPVTALIVERSSERINPAGDSGLRTIGRLGSDGPSEMAGIERAYDDQLRGTDGKSEVELKRGSTRGMSGWAATLTREGLIDLSRKGGALPDTVRVVKEAIPGSSVQLTIDRAIQHDVERILIDGAVKAGARRGIAVVGKPTTGELLSVASVEIDPDTGKMEISDGPLAYSNAYQAGSVFKLVTVAAGIESGEVSADTVFEVPDHIQVSDKTFSDHDPHVPEAMTVTDIVAQSSNVGTIMISQKVGKERLHKTLIDFGFGRRSGVGHPAEAAGIVPPLDQWTNPDLAAASIGTHETATALQLWAAYNVVANQGMYVAPRLVGAILHPDGTRDVPEVEAPRRVVSATTASALSSVLQSVITEGTGKQWTLPGYSVAAKTGTSRMPSPTRVDRSDGYMWVDGRYHYLAAFAGYLPAGRPQVSITVILDDVDSGLYGSTAAGPIFSQLARLSIRELGIAPDEDADGSTKSELLPGTVLTESGRIRTAPATAATESTTGSDGSQSSDDSDDSDDVDGSGSSAAPPHGANSRGESPR